MKFKLIESEYESHLDKDFQNKKRIDLSSLDLSVRKRKDDGESNLYTWKKDGEFVGQILVDTIPASDGYRWFGSFRIGKKYRGHGLSHQILDFAINECKAGALAVNKDNEVAIRLYKEHGFQMSEDRFDDEYYFLYLPKNKETVKL